MACALGASRCSVGRFQLAVSRTLPGARKQPYAVRNADDLMVATAGFGKSAITPIFTISSVDGTGLPLLRLFFNLMPARRKWAQLDTLPPEFLIDQYFNVPGVGLVVAGTLIRGVVQLNHQLLMGPNNQGKHGRTAKTGWPKQSARPPTAPEARPLGPGRPLWTREESPHRVGAGRGAAAAL